MHRTKTDGEGYGWSQLSQWDTPPVDAYIDSGFVVMAQSTSKMSISEMSELIELATAFGCQHNVKWKDDQD